MNESQNSAYLGKLIEVFGGQKAEWLGPMLFELFSEPSYFPQMTTARPCVLVGGRGTGKTTVLRGLSYEGQYAIRGRNDSGISDWPYYGMYYRIDTNRVNAFQGPELSDLEWTRRFAHYVNLTMCIQVGRFLEWFQDKTGTSTELDLEARRHVASTLNIDVPDSNADLLRSLRLALARFEGHINNVASAKGPDLSMQEAPVQSLFEAISSNKSFQGKLFFFLMDEYENLQNYQQRLVNTLIKHCGEVYTFKVGVRELGWRVHSTLNDYEQLTSPADYMRIDINQGGFADFAHKVCQDRLDRVMSACQGSGNDIRELLPELHAEQEAKLLGVDQVVSPVVERLRRIDTEGALDGMSPLTIYLLDFWSRSQEKRIEEVFEDFQKNRSTWETRSSNYQHALLYTILRGKRGIRKYYAGWDTFVQISGNNIRYLLQLVEESLTQQLRDGKSLTEPVSPETQTLSSQRVGRMNLTELEGLAVKGAKLTKLLLGLGRVLGVMAATPEGHTPEVNQFEIVAGGEKVDQEEVDSLLTAGVMHLALVRWSGSKPADEGDTKDWDYMIHPIYAPFFVISYRRKRKLGLTGFQLLELVMNPREAIKRVLADNNRIGEEPLPEQLRLFEMYYANEAK